ncbi:MAG: sigma 54-interacting transcriptional regulator [Peptococcaceae bacterium]|nr:sigma 54-interacting transcriptional regulator [Peptococcaceae bacterium]MDH7525037.1 sigma 54-interacting transcriptional regulator [Peptococcaceae bacterium]
MSLNISLLNDKTESFREWESFIRNGNEPQKIRSCILASWQRCKVLNVNPLGGESQSVLTREELYTRLEEKSVIINTSVPYIKNIYKIVKGSGFVVFLCDEKANILYILGDKEELEELRLGTNFKTGSNWSEKNVGTTAVGVVLAEGKVIQIKGDEHYCLRQKKWTSSAVPIRDPRGNITAVLSIMGSSEKVYSHTLGMLVAAELAIRNQLQVLETSEKLLVSNKYYKAVIEAVSEGILAVDSKGYVTCMNKSAGKILFTDPGEAIGKHVTEVVDFRPVILDVLRTGEGYVDKEFIINSKRGRLHFFKSAVPIRGEDGQIDGVVDVFREIKQVKHLVNQMVGAQARFTFDNIIGSSREMVEAKRLARIAAKSMSNVLIIGDSGTGKELFAQAIHNASPRAGGPFIAINCGAIPRELIESELFGYEGGAFTGAKQDGRPGKFEMATGGTIFLDEIAEMPFDMQVKLLRVLQEREVTRVGGNKTIAVDIRVIAATNKDLHREMSEETFRKDLYWRLNVLTIYLPLLSQRSSDIPELVAHFLHEFSKRHNTKYTLDAGTMEILLNYSWPGNVRELENTLERAIAFAEGSVIMPHHLPKNLLAKNKGPHSSSQVVSLEQAEREAIAAGLAHCRGNISKAAKMLGVSRNTLYSKIMKYGLEY